MTTIRNLLPFSVVPTPTAGAFCISPEKHQKSPLKLLPNTAKALHHTAITVHFLMTATHPNILQYNTCKTAHFKST